MDAHVENPWVHARAQPVPAQGQRRVAEPAEGRIVRQVAAIDAWNTTRQMRERQLSAGSRSRLDREAATRQLDTLRRTHEAIAACAAKDLARETGPLLSPGATAVIAHRHGWFAEKVATLLQDRGVSVVECTDNGADALGAVVAEQPDVVLTGDLLAMMPGDVLLTETRLFSPATRRVLQAGSEQQAKAWLPEADAVFLRHHPPADIADVVSAFCRAPAMQHGAGR